MKCRTIITVLSVLVLFVPAIPSQLWVQKNHSSEAFAVVQDRIRTNTLETWEGKYTVSGVYPLSSWRQSDNLCLCVYSCPQAEGNLAELYRVTNEFNVLRLLAANVNVKGVRHEWLPEDWSNGTGSRFYDEGPTFRVAMSMGFRCVKPVMTRGISFKGFRTCSYCMLAVIQRHPKVNKKGKNDEDTVITVVNAFVSCLVCANRTYTRRTKIEKSSTCLVYACGLLS